MTDRERLETLTPALLNWFHDNARTLPWRSDPTPYHVLLSEIMLQQTRVAAVLDYYARFTAEFPDVESLAACNEERLMKLWQGLGYYSRARNLHRAAQAIVSCGKFPDTYEEILKLPGVGGYTAGAIASIAFGLPEPAVDGNVLRVITRICGDRSDITKPETKKNITALLREVIPTALPGAYNQTLMELGALICVPNGTPQCDRCPAADLCKAKQLELTGEIPVKAPKKARRIEERTLYLIVNGGRLALRRRPEKGLLAGLWELPDELPEGIVPVSMESAGKGKHIFTHIEWHMTGVLVRTQSDKLPDGWVWADRYELAERYSVPGAFACFLPAAESAMKEGER